MKFGLVGVSNTLLGFAVIVGLQEFARVPPVIANAAGYLVGGAWSYALNRRWTFRSRRPHRQAVVAFGMAMLTCWLINVMVLKFALAHVSAIVAQGLAVGAYTVTFYVISKRWVFRE